ncbi:hypothetical protein ACET3Z_032350 [Daucus carota]
MAVTHDDLAPSRRGMDLRSRTGAVLMIISVVFGLICFIFSLIAEATRSQVNWASTTNGDAEKYECTYTSSGKTPLFCACGAFGALAIAMIVEHTYMLIAVSKSTDLVTWEPESSSAKNLTWQAAFFFFTTWICFAVGEILLLVGISVESGHLKNWSSSRPNCLVLKQGLFLAAGVFGLATILLASGLYITILRVQKLLLEEEIVRRQALEAAMLYASPPRSPGHRLETLRNESPVIRQHNEHDLSLYISAFSKNLFLNSV